MQTNQPSEETVTPLQGFTGQPKNMPAEFLAKEIEQFAEENDAVGAECLLLFEAARRVRSQASLIFALRQLVLVADRGRSIGFTHNYIADARKALKDAGIE